MRPAPRLRRFLWPLLACLAAAGLVATLSACGGDAPATAKTPTETQTQPKEPQATPGRAKTPAEIAKERPRPVDQASNCNALVGELLGSMDALRKNLVVGLSYEEYVSEMKRIRSAYEAIPAEQMTLGCIAAAGSPAERGLNQYIAANNAWTECVETPGCKSATIEAELQERWRSGSKYLSKAQKGLLALDRS